MGSKRTPLAHKQTTTMLHIEIDAGSGFCFGVTTAIKKAEEELGQRDILYCLGDIVHNSRECERLRERGLVIIDHETFATLRDVRVLLRAHGEPPSTYEIARRNNITLVDATCPVVLNLQQRISRVYHEMENPQIVIYGKHGHAEVLGLVGQTNSEAIVISDISEVDKVDLTRNTYLFSQTTKPLEGFQTLIDYLTTHIQPPAEFRCYDTNLSPRFESTARGAGICPAPRPHSLRLRTQKQQRACAFRGLSQGQCQYAPDRRPRIDRSCVVLRY